MALKHYDDPLSYDPNWNGPSAVQRRETDLNGKYFFYSGLFIWLTLGVTLSLYQGYRSNELIAYDVNNEVDTLMVERYENVLYYLDTFVYSPVTLIRHSFSNSTVAAAIFGNVLLTIFLAYSYITLIRYSAKIIIWTFINLFFGAIVICTILYWIKIEQHENYNERHCYKKGIVLVIFLLIVTVVALFYRRKINIACEIIKEASKSVLHFPSNYCMALAKFLLSFVTLIFFVNFARTMIHVQFGRHKLKLTKINYYFWFLHIYNIFMYLWVRSFLNGVSYMMSSLTYATWYWTHKKETILHHTVKRSIKTVAENHLGTVGTGSFFMVLLSVVKTCLKAVIRESSNERDSCERCTAQLIGCCFSGVINAIMHVSRNAYISCALHSTDFFDSAKNAFHLIKRNLASVVITYEISTLLFGFGGLIVIVCPMCLSWIVIETSKSAKELDHIIDSVWMGWLIIIMLGLTFFELLHAAIETIFLSAVEDFERNDGTKERPYYMSEKLKRLLIKTN